MSGALAGGVNEAAVAKLMKTLGPNNPDLVQIASAALGYATNKMAGEDALAGAALAQYSGTLVKTKIDKFLNVSGSRHCSIEQQCREVALCWRDVPDG